MIIHSTPCYVYTLLPLHGDTTFLVLQFPCVANTIYELYPHLGQCCRSSLCQKPDVLESHLNEKIKGSEISKRVADKFHVLYLAVAPYILTFCFQR